MSRFELSLSKDYVPDWTVVDAVRELFQNALDQQTVLEDNEMFFDYDEAYHTLTIGNKMSVLETSSLLLGSTTKRNNHRTIGQFGEGYKVATLVLVRENKNITFYNYGAREVWRPRFVKSRKYGADILTFFIDKKFAWTKVPDNNLTIVIEGITPEEYEEIKKSNLHINKPVETIQTNLGRILLDDNLKGKVFVEGLYVCDFNGYNYGYDFKSENIKLDRDRKLVSDFDLKWLASKMWITLKDSKYFDMFNELVEKGAEDVIYASEVYALDNNIEEMATWVFNAFKDKYGTNAVPVTSSYEIEGLSQGYKPIIVAEPYKKVLMKSPLYEEPKRKYVPTLLDKLEHWLHSWEDTLNVEASMQLKQIIKEEKEYGKSKDVPF